MVNRYETTKVVQPIKRALEKIGCVVHKTHGGLYSSGLPDLLIWKPNGSCVCIETKYITTRNISGLGLINHLSTTQLGFFTWLRKRTQAKILIIGGNENGGYVITRFPPLNEDVLRTRTLEETIDYIIEY